MADGETWQAIAAKKRESAYEKIPNEWRLSTEKLEGLGQASNANVLNIPRESGILSARELEITEKYDAVALLEQLASGKFSSTEVTLAFSKRAAIAQQVVSTSKMQLIVEMHEYLVNMLYRPAASLKHFSTRPLQGRSI